jgi:hypothetical protein
VSNKQAGVAFNKIWEKVRIHVTKYWQPDVAIAIADALAELGWETPQEVDDKYPEIRDHLIKHFGYGDEDDEGDTEDDIATENRLRFDRQDSSEGEEDRERDGAEA